MWKHEISRYLFCCERKEVKKDKYHNICPVAKDGNVPFQRMDEPELLRIYKEFTSNEEPQSPKELYQSVVNETVNNNFFGVHSRLFWGVLPNENTHKENIPTTVGISELGKYLFPVVDRTDNLFTIFDRFFLYVVIDHDHYEGAALFVHIFSKGKLDLRTKTTYPKKLQLVEIQGRKGYHIVMTEYGIAKTTRRNTILDATVGLFIDHEDFSSEITLSLQPRYWNENRKDRTSRFFIRNFPRINLENVKSSLTFKEFEFFCCDQFGLVLDKEEIDRNLSRKRNTFVVDKGTNL